MDTKLVIAALVGAAIITLVRIALDWLGNRYGVTAVTPWRVRPARRWYGIRSHIQRRAADLTVDPDGYVYEVLDFSDAHTDTPWVLVVNTADQVGTGAFWYPVTGFSAYSVSRFRPVLVRRWGAVPWPVLFRHETLPGVQSIRISEEGEVSA